MTKKIETAEELAVSALRREDEVVVTLVASADALVIETAEQLEASSALLTGIKGRRRILENLRTSITRPMDEAKRRVMEVFRPAEGKLLDAERTIKNAVLDYTREQERLRLEAQARVDEAARRERERIQRLAERQREAGREERAAASEERAEAVEAPTVEAPPKPTGAVHVRTTWHAEVVDLAELVGAVAAGKLPVELLLPNMVALNELARTLKEKLGVPGVRAIAERGVAARAE